VNVCSKIAYPNARRGKYFCRKHMALFKMDEKTKCTSCTRKLKKTKWKINADYKRGEQDTEQNYCEHCCDKIYYYKKFINNVYSVCEVCSKWFITRNALFRHHEKQHHPYHSFWHPIKPVPQIYPVCSKAQVTLQLSSEEICLQCGTIFLNQTKLEHQRDECDKPKKYITSCYHEMELPNLHESNQLCFKQESKPFLLPSEYSKYYESSSERKRSIDESDYLKMLGFGEVEPPTLHEVDQLKKGLKPFLEILECESFIDELDYIKMLSLFKSALWSNQHLTYLDKLD
jgi:hypothetical protein